MWNNLCCGDLVSYKVNSSLSELCVSPDARKVAVSCNRVVTVTLRVNESGL